jgi:hypothetical protein
LGYDVPPTPIGPPRTSNGRSTDQIPDNQSRAMPIRQTAATPSLPSSPPNRVNQYNSYANGPTITSSHKRGRDDDDHDPYQPIHIYSPPPTKASFELMPPPQLPVRRYLETPTPFVAGISANYASSHTQRTREASPEANILVPMISNTNPPRQYATLPPTPQRGVERPQAVQDNLGTPLGHHVQDSTWLPNGNTQSVSQTPARQIYATPQRFQHWIPSSGRNRERQMELPSTPVNQSHIFRPPTQRSDFGIEQQGTFTRYKNNPTPAARQNVPQIPYSSHRNSNLGSQFIPLQTPSRHFQPPQRNPVPVKTSYITPAPILPSLNSLSFINDPYSSHQRRIYSSHFSRQNNPVQNRSSDDSQRMARPPSQHDYNPFSKDPRSFRPANGLAVEDTSSSAGNFQPTRNALRGYGRQQYPVRPVADSGVFRTRARSSMGASFYNTNNMRRRVFR